MCESKHLHTMKPFILIELFYFERDTEQKSAHDDRSISVECRNIVGFRDDQVDMLHTEALSLCLSY